MSEKIRNPSNAKSGKEVHFGTAFGMLDHSVVRECDHSILHFSIIVLVGFVGSALMRWFVFSETLQFLGFDATFLWITLSAVTLVGLSLDHTFFRSSLERVAIRNAKVTARHVTAMLPMFNGSLIYHFVLRVLFLTMTMGLMLIILLQSSQGPIETAIQNRQTDANVAVSQRIEAELDQEEEALRDSIRAAEAGLAATMDAWTEQNGLEQRKVEELYNQAAQLKVRESTLHAEIVDLTRQKDTQEALMYCEEFHSSASPIPGCEKASGKPGIGKIYRAAKREAGILSAKILAIEAGTKQNAVDQRAISSRIDSLQLTELDTAAERTHLKDAQSKLTEFGQTRTDRAQARFKSSPDKVTLDSSSLAQQLSALSEVWAQTGVVVPLGIIATMFAVFDLGFGLIALFFSPREYIAKLTKKMTVYEADTDRAVHEFVVDRVGYVRAAKDAALDIEVQTKMRSSKFIRSEIKVQQDQAAERRKFSSTMRRQYYKHASAAANSNSPRHQ